MKLPSHASVLSFISSNCVRCTGTDADPAPGILQCACPHYRALQHSFIHQADLPPLTAIAITAANALPEGVNTVLFPVKCEMFVFRGGRSKQGRAFWHTRHIPH